MKKLKTLFIIMLSTIFGTALFLTLGTLLALKKVPQLVNIPNKEYWFTPEHKQDTIAFVFKIMVKLTIANTHGMEKNLNYCLKEQKHNMKVKHMSIFYTNKRKRKVLAH